MQAIELSTTISAQGGIALPANFRALYGRDARMILLIDDDVVLVPPTPNRIERQANLRQALAAVAQAGTFAHIDDAVAWQREMRAERPQPGRGD
ncbi:MAG: hypothetical protein IPH37_05345 [Burkholderiales bacterium]|jgi:hypothetical protein|nr:hypothetical protein [Burkholderiales bacterium]